MRRTGVKVFLASALGAGVGSLVALYWAPVIFWWLGAIIGACVGFAAYDFVAWVSAIPFIVKDTTIYYRYRKHDVFKRRIPPRFWATFGFSMLFCASMVIYFLMMIFGTLMLYGASVSDIINHFAGYINPLLMFFGQAAIFIIIGSFVAVFPLAIAAQMPWSRREANDLLSAIKWGAINFSPPVLLFWHVPRLIYRGVVRAVRAPILAGRSLGRFVREAFWRVQSSMGLLCGANAMLGAAVGFFAGSALIGAAVGGLFGLASYEIVSKRLLHIEARGPNPQ